MSATSYIYLSNRKILTLLHRPPPNTPKELGSSRGWVGGVEGGIEMKPLGMEKKKSKALFTPANFGRLYSAPIGLIVNLFRMAPTPGRSVWV